MDVERRFLGAPAELRLSGDATAGAGTTITGLAAVFNSPSEDLGGWREILAPGCFSRALRERQDVVAIVNHNPDLILGRVSNGSLALAEDARGLRVAIRPPETPTAREVRTLIKGGFAAGMSFAFIATRDGIVWREDADGPVREVRDIQLLADVSVITGTQPAYSETTIAARAGARAGSSTSILRLRLSIS